MKRSFSTLFVFSLLLLLFGSVQSFAQEPGQAMISIYNVAPGKHLDFLKWMAQQESIDKEAGLPPTQWYAHQDGAAWDFIAIGPVTTPEQDKKVEEVAKQKGRPTGFKAALQFRTFVSSHTDTVARGPSSASDLVKAGE